MQPEVSPTTAKPLDQPLKQTNLSDFGIDAPIVDRQFISKHINDSLGKREGPYIQPPVSIAGTSITGSGYDIFQLKEGQQPQQLNFGGKDEVLKVLKKDYEDWRRTATSGGDKTFTIPHYGTLPWDAARDIVKKDPEDPSDRPFLTKAFGGAPLPLPIADQNQVTQTADL